MPLKTKDIFFLSDNYYLAFFLVDAEVIYKVNQPWFPSALAARIAGHQWHMLSSWSLLKLSLTMES